MAERPFRKHRTAVLNKQNGRFDSVMTSRGGTLKSDVREKGWFLPGVKVFVPCYNEAIPSLPMSRGLKNP